MLPRLRSIAEAIFHRSRLEHDMDEELRFHLERRTEDLIRSGLAPGQAERRARIELGAKEFYKEECREARGLRLFNECTQDLRYALRTLKSNPGFAAVVIFSLALGIGANTAIFSLLDTVILKSLPVSKPAELFVIRKVGPKLAPDRFSHPLFERLRGVMPASAGLIATSRTARMNTFVDGSQEPEWCTGQLVSGEYFSVLGVYPVLGRILTPEDNRTLGGHPAAEISHAFWQRRFGGSPLVLGRGLKLNGAHFTIVGVAPTDFSGLFVGSAADLWIPAMMQADIRYSQNYTSSNGQSDKPWVPQEQIYWLDLVLRASPQHYQSALIAVTNMYQQQIARAAEQIGDPEARRLFLQQSVALEPCGRGFSSLRRQFSTPLFVLMGMVGVVLLICCANVANLLLARASARQREIAVRLSMGAGRGRLIRQLLTESILLGFFGGAAGLLVAQWTASSLAKMILGKGASLDLDGRVLGFTAVVSLATGIVFGLAPAFRAIRVNPGATLKTGSVLCPEVPA